MRLIIIVGLIFLTGCSARWYARQAEKYTAKAVALGAAVKFDTVYKNIEVRVPEIKTDTIERLESFWDTVYVEKKGIKAKFKMRKDTTAFAQVICPPKDTVVRAPITIKKIIQCPPCNRRTSIWTIALYLLLGLVLGIVARSLIK